MLAAPEGEPIGLAGFGTAARLTLISNTLKRRALTIRQPAPRFFPSGAWQLMLKPPIRAPQREDVGFCGKQSSTNSPMGKVVVGTSTTAPGSVSWSPITPPDPVPTR